MKFENLKKNIENDAVSYSLPMLYLEETEPSNSLRKIAYSKFYNGFIIIEPFYKHIHRLI